MQENKQQNYLLLKKGILSEDTKGRPVLVNPEGNAYAINHLLQLVWNEMDGRKAQEQIVENILMKQHGHSNLPYQKQEIFKIIEKLKSVDLASELL